MCDKNDHGPDFDDEVLDSLLRAAHEKRTGAGPDIPEETVLAYLAGEATEEEVSRVRRALLEDPRFRSEFREMARDYDELTAADAVRKYRGASHSEIPDYEEFVLGRRRRPAAAGERGRFREVLFVLFRRPAFAYAMLLLLMGYPTFRFFYPAESFIVGGQALLLTEDRRVVLRGEEEEPGPEEIRIDRSSPVLALTLLSPVDPEGGRRYAVAVLSGSRELWRDEDYRGFTGVGNDTYLHLQLNPRMLEPGPFVVRVEEFAGDGEPLGENSYSFVLKFR